MYSTVKFSTVYCQMQLRLALQSSSVETKSLVMFTNPRVWETYLVMHCTVQSCNFLYSPVCYSTVLYFNLQSCILPYSPVFCCIVLQLRYSVVFIVQSYILLYGLVFYCTVLQYTLFCICILSKVLYFIVQSYILVPCPVFNSTFLSSNVFYSTLLNIIASSRVGCVKN